MTTPHILAVMGSGETAPTMVTTHRMLASKLPKSARAVLLDTPYGFQENAPELASKAVDYFQTSVNLDLEVAGLTEIIGADSLSVERGLQKVADADYVFAGPGSPTYALRQWSGTSLAGLLNKKLRDGGIVTFASAAALTLGRFTLPVYEIYKVGEDPRWLDGLNILGEIGVNVALIPHYNNAEGGHHDTRYCYMGERRLSILERELPAGVFVLGVDEHTGMVIDLDTETVTVVGKGVVTIRIQGESTQIASGETFSLDRLRDPASATTRNTKQTKISTEKPVTNTSATEAPAIFDNNLREATDRLNNVFTTAIANSDADGAARAALELDDAITGWSGDTLQSDATNHARSVLRSMITRLAEAATGGLRDPRDVLGPYIQVLLDLRAQVRADKRFDLSDIIRDRLIALNIEVRDTPDGAKWGFRTN
ncbi:MAG: hypothetical protein EBS27_04010 [Actinobacteria bacterium]|nr:hypothetical protein [Actinomycetota bacterium]